MKDYSYTNDTDSQIYKWGIVWLKAIDDIYVNNGFSSIKLVSGNINGIKNLDISGNEVTAEVKGSDFRLYVVKLKFNQVNNNVLEEIKRIIFTTPSISLQLASGHLPDPFIKDILSNNISIFPSSINDVKISCSCNQGLSCQHIISIYGALEKEINNNPFLLFNLAGISTSELINSSSLKDIMDKKIRKGIHNKFIPISDNMIKPFEEDFVFKFQDFTPSEINSLFELLPPNPVFYDRKDFKAKLVSIYETIETDLDSILVKEELPPLRNTEFYLYYSKDNVLKAFVSPANSFLYYLKSKGSRSQFSNERLSLPIWNEEDEKYLLKDKEGIVTLADNVFDYFLYSVLSTDESIISVSSKYLNKAASLALALVKSLSFVPEIVMQDHINFTVRYVPLTDKAEIRENIDYIESIMPVNLISKDNGNKILKKNASYDILSMFITHIIHKLTFLKASKIKKGDVTNIFTKSQVFGAILSDGKNAAISISNWLDILSAKNNPLRPVIRIESSPNSSSEKQIFSVFIDVINSDNNQTMELSALFNDENAENIVQDKQSVVDISNQLVIAANYIPLLKIILDSKGMKVPDITLKEVLDLMSNISHVLNLLGIEIIIPDELKNIFTPRVSLKAKIKNHDADFDSIFNPENNSPSAINKLFDFSYEVAIGDKSVTREEFLELVKEADGIVRYKDQYVVLKPEDINAIIDRLNKPLPEISSSLELLHSTMSGLYNEFYFNADDALKRAVDDFIKIDEIAIPEKLEGTLRPYQERGYRWLYSNSARGFGSCIADDMGLGKTIQVISMLLKFKEENKLVEPALVICPTTLVGNWQKECAKFAPSLKVHIYHGTDRELKLNNIDVIITTYGLLRGDIDKFKDKTWDIVIIDEAQNIKNPDTAQTIAVKSIKTKMAIAMTGTPVENRLSELWSIFDFTNKGYLGSIADFQRNYAFPIEKQRNFDSIEKLKLVTQPFVLRRLKNDKSIITDLPEKIIFDEYCYLTKEQAALYEKVLENSFKTIENKSGIHRKGHIFKLITSLKQICNHPVQYTKIDKPIKTLSGKTEKTFSIIENVLEQNEKIIIFTQYKEMGDLLVEMIKDEFKQDVPFFHGSVPRIKRDRMVEEFQTNNDINLMIISLKAGGTGLNLTAATNVLHYDLWWNPAVEDQATDRTYRIGQLKNVIVHRLITLGTFEEKIDEMIKSKKELADLTVSSGEKLITELSDRELKEIFSLAKY
jgi:SNF2 family DNA or RNA helicase/uncharacterized Zn finger protein